MGLNNVHHECKNHETEQRLVERNYEIRDVGVGRLANRYSKSGKRLLTLELGREEEKPASDRRRARDCHNIAKQEILRGRSNEGANGEVIGDGRFRKCCAWSQKAILSQKR